ncbi:MULTISPECIES: precorrin-3B C(17)-methyltransferase [unclassified Leptolyngbya]|uniref:precorrin-3B C(17)-methyltransferase n=1 Tax=unclassified Leptolyngbya TaxID=2650499 RepID=UPI0016846AA2|nr:MULTISPECIES: precorrin-3B C(17)-methyltransferase [unclassified Leptolyngbya]MBD1910644.1 precorrin-3B C(17)-methyltransferase [Leptolyngbya sp. FACHB-8]MBD2154584.1 precorrin-3B C(17)-methyltransferase [Leptolyngbya sp. FACHB-16]
MILQDFQPAAAIALTPLAIHTLQPLWEIGAVTLYLPQELANEVGVSAHCKIYTGSLKEQLPELWRSHRALVFGLATGAVVRLIAPLLQNKAIDPAVVVVDGPGRHVISLCGGHQGGADRLAVAIAQLLQATPVLTGGANALELPAIDTLGVPFGWSRGRGDWTEVSAAIAQGQSIRVYQSAGTDLWHRHLPEPHPFSLLASQPDPQDGSPCLHIGATSPPVLTAATVAWHPRVLWVGMGCERGTTVGVIETALQQALAVGGFAAEAIAGIATLDLKADEEGLLQICRDRRLSLQCFSAETLRQVPVPNPSEVVAAEVETPSVAEAAAIWASYQADINPLASESAPALEDAALRLRVTKQIVRVPGEKGAVTVAIAQSHREFTGRQGQIWLVGTGPGHLSQITPAAQGAIAQADVVIGYSLYVDLIQPLLRPGQIVEALPITQERQRAERAIELAQWGLTVAVISSGDCGIYGMAGLVLEQLQTQGWDGKTPDVQVFPGITALQAAASRVGAPLMHDFCAISLSDLLTPWPQIEKRLAAAAQADFVTALYNPRSRSRVEQLAIAQSIFLAHRSPETPVAIVQSAYRPTEIITLTTLADLLQHPVDMLSTVLIGNQTTRFHHQWMITPRGYLGFSGN